MRQPPGRLIALCRRWHESSSFNLAIAALIALSVILLVPEIYLPRWDPTRLNIGFVQETLAGLFAIELVIRYGAVGDGRRFWKEYWVDVLAVVPVLQPFRVFRFMKLLRLLRIFRLVKILSNTRRFRRWLGRGRVEYTTLLVMLILSVVLGGVGFTWFEHAHAGAQQVEESFWIATFSLISAEYIHNFPPSLGGKVIVLLLEFAGLSLFAVLTGTVSILLVERLREGAGLAGVRPADLDRHVIVCGWNSGSGAALVRLQSHPDFVDRGIVIIADREHLPGLRDLPDPTRLCHLRDDFTRAEVLNQANVAQAAVALLFADIDKGRSRQDADARTVLAALTIEKLNPGVHTCAELSNSANQSHLKMGRVNEVIVTQDLAGHLLAQAALHSTGARLMRQLLHSERTISLPVTGELVGLTFSQAVARLATEGMVAMAVQAGPDDIRINPGELQLESGQVLLCLNAG